MSWFQANSLEIFVQVLKSILKPDTSGALLSGLFVLLRPFDFLEEMDYDTDKLLILRNVLKTVALNFLE